MASSTKSGYSIVAKDGNFQVTATLTWGLTVMDYETKNFTDWEEAVNWGELTSAKLLEDYEQSVGDDEYAESDGED